MVVATGGDSEKALVEAVAASRAMFRRGLLFWAATYYGALFGAAVLSALAAIVLQVPDVPATDLAAIFAIVAALLTTLSSVGNFQSKWHADRDAFHALELLRLDIADPAVAEDAVRRRYKRIMRVQHGAWIQGEGRDSGEGEPA